MAIVAFDRLSTRQCCSRWTYLVLFDGSSSRAHLASLFGNDWSNRSCRLADNTAVDRTNATHMTQHFGDRSKDYSAETLPNTDTFSAEIKFDFQQKRNSNVRTNTSQSKANGTERAEFSESLFWSRLRDQTNKKVPKFFATIAHRGAFTYLRTSWYRASKLEHRNNFLP